MIDVLLGLLKKRTIVGIDGPYLTKYTLFDFGKEGVRAHLHHFHRSDEDTELHSHPWEWSFGLILSGGYIETRLSDVVGLRQKLFSQGMINFIRHDDFHRIEMLGSGRECWTLFVSGPVRHTWFFLDPDTKRLWPWKEFIRRKGLEA